MKSILRLFLSLTVVSKFLQVYCIKFHEAIIMRVEDKFYVSKNEYTVDQLKDYLRKGPCTSLKYTHYLKRDGCLPVPVENKICGGLCHSETNPKELDSMKQSMCNACGPSLIVEKEFAMLCKRKHQKNGSDMKMVKVKAKVVRECSCEKYKCIKDL